MTYLRFIAALWALTFLLAIVGCRHPIKPDMIQTEAFPPQKSLQ